MTIQERIARGEIVINEFDYPRHDSPIYSDDGAEEEQTVYTDNEA